MFESSDPYEEAFNSMGFWYPLLQEIGMRTPKTVLVHSDVDLWANLDKPSGDSFAERLVTAARYVSNSSSDPVFLRTANTSNKHDWTTTCYVTDYSKFKSHVYNLMEASMMANIAGSPWNTQLWAVREMLPVKKHFEAFDGMPVTTEYRYFIKDGKVQCKHEYWPKEAFDGDPENKLEPVYKDIDSSEADLMAAYMAKKFHGYWSVDFLLSEDGKWYCIDMAVGERSYHAPECKYFHEALPSNNASKSNLTEVEKGRWEVAIPLPYYGLRKQCKCGDKFWTIRGYHGHYAFVHIYAGVGV